jgi:hypothetical protein
MLIVGGGGSQERGAIVGGRMTEKGRGEGDLVETFELLHEITSLPYFRAPRSSERAGTYSACILGVWLRCQRHGQRVPGPIGGVIDWGLVNLFIIGFFCNFNIIFNHVVGPICRRNLHRQPLHHLTCLVSADIISF